MPEREHTEESASQRVSARVRCTVLLCELCSRFASASSAVYCCFTELRLVLGSLCAHQISLRLVTESCPFSPLFPFVSSTALIVSISTSPRRGFNKAKGTSKRISRSCQIVLASSAAEEEELDIAEEAAGPQAKQQEQEQTRGVQRNQTASGGLQQQEELR